MASAAVRTRPASTRPRASVEHGAAGARPHLETAGGRRQQVAELQLLQPDSGFARRRACLQPRARRADVEPRTLARDRKGRRRDGELRGTCAPAVGSRRQRRVRSGRMDDERRCRETTLEERLRLQSIDLEFQVCRKGVGFESRMGARGPPEIAVRRDLHLDRVGGHPAVQCDRIEFERRSAGHIEIDGAVAHRQRESARMQREPLQCRARRTSVRGDGVVPK